MTSTPTTLVLGAGASKPYRFPTGRELAGMLNNESDLHELGELHPLSKRDVHEFCETFHRSQMYSIDAFLARRGNDSWSAGAPTFGEIGKLAISLVLSRCEDANRLFINQGDHWYRYLWNCIGTSLDGLKETQLRIITFNYDRSLEYYLLTTIQNSFGILRDKAAEHLRYLPILHVYGQLGDLPELAENRNDACAYDHQKVTAVRIRTGARSIRVIDEQRDEDEVFARALEWIKTSHRICFIGFGFDSTNVRRLKLRELRAQSLEASFDSIQCAGYATTYGMEDAERALVINLLTRGRPLFGNSEDVRKYIEPYRLHEPEAYLRATGILSRRDG